MTKFLVGLEKFLHSLTHSFCRHIVKTFTFLYLFLKQQKVLHLFCQHPTENSGNRMISAVFITFKKSLDPHKLRLYLTPKAFFFDAFQKLPSGNTGPTHTVTHTTKCAERFKEHRRGNRFLSGALLACGTYRMKN